MNGDTNKKILNIDAVVTWVDGNDPKHRSKRKKYKRQNLDVVNELLTGRDNTRFVDNGELAYCLFSIKKFAPWIRKIFLVTDDQIPGFADKEFRAKYNIEIVDHTTIFNDYEWALPTFNTRTIESVLWRISDLSSHFIYFNDDFILTKPVFPADFFQEGKVVLRGGWYPIRNYGAIRMKMNAWISNLAKNLFGITRSMHLLLQIKSARIAGFNSRYFKSPHVPHPVRKETLKRFFEVNSSLLENNIRYKFRNMDQFSAIFLANHLEIGQDNAIFDQLNDFLMINGEMEIGAIFSSKLNKIQDQDVRFLCLQGLESLNDEQRLRLDKALRDQLNMDMEFVKPT